jgi:2-polyprenyl-3-methyl-5-hydroxy-6-metoxy-1,4-benzoquinol methylase
MTAKDALFNPSYTGLRMDLLRHVEGRDLRVLDVGCASGANGRYLLEQGIAAYVEGLEIDETMAAEAVQHLSRVIVGNIEDAAVFARISAEPFDRILIGDVLEHLVDPWLTLRQLGARLSRDGLLLFSVPNIGHIDVFIHLFIKKYWPYNPRGIFDRTHLRFFTRRNVLELVDQAGLQLEALHRNYRFRDRQDSRFPPHGVLLRALFRDYYTFQFIALCRRPDAGSAL